MQYVAFLLGINLGTRSIKMADLKALMEKEGYKNVRTVIASGNVVFDAPKQKPGSLSMRLETVYEKKFGFKIGVIVRTMGEIEKMLSAKPFKSVKVTKDIRRYVTFLSETAPKGERARSVVSAFKILKVSPYEVYTVLDLSLVAKTPDVMKYLGATFGKKTTMRNWNTIEKIAALAK
jgi:uncharacterized protein (DUF1697 family)